MVAWAVEAGLPLSVIGARWDWLPEGAWIRRHIRNSKLGAFYASAKVVLNDHPPEMRLQGYVNNRVFDVLACGTPLVSDPVAGLPDGFDEFVYFADDPQSLKDAIAEAASEDAPMRARRREFSEYVREFHSFDARVVVLVDALGLGSETSQIAKEARHA
jgi:spore maturation protein CgeB